MKIGGWFFGTLVVAGMVLWNRICPSFCWSGRFLGMVSLVFSKFWHDARNPYEVVRDRAGFSRKKNFVPKFGKMGQKQGFFNILKNFVINFYWICSIMKIYIISCVPAQFLFLRYGPKCSQQIRWQYFLISDFLHVDSNSHKIWKH